ncbi:hypothetical protein MNBD_ALPHA04-204 [hydrothermal vent metagenome]|uniref:Uncharacterized protein n=1 Tax=hydrothermal vent metagenome TaxID=652676 RepID=A0A3B0SMF4_9ZZZZ
MDFTYTASPSPIRWQKATAFVEKIYMFAEVKGSLTIYVVEKIQTQKTGTRDARLPMSLLFHSLGREMRGTAYWSPLSPLIKTVLYKPLPGEHKIKRLGTPIPGRFRF